MNSKFYKDLKAGLDEYLEYLEGKIELRTTVIEVPEPPAEYKAKDIKKIETTPFTKLTCQGS
jgi:putative transcriptional regulator